MTYIADDGISTVTDTANTHVETIGMVDGAGDAQYVQADRVGNALRVSDNYQNVVVVADKTSGDYEDLSLGGTVDMLVIRIVGGNGRCNPKGGVIDSSTGIYCPDGEPMYFPVETSAFSISVPTGSIAYCFGLQRA